MNFQTLLFGFLCLGIGTVAFAQNDNDQCEISASWGDIDGRSSTVMIMRQDQEQFDDGDTVLVAFFNQDWSISEGDTLGRIKVENEGGGWFDNEAVALENGFAIWSEFDHVQNVFGEYARAMILTRDGQILDRLSQTGLRVDWMQFKSCRYSKVSARDERERKERLAREIPKDPFAH